MNQVQARDLIRITFTHAFNRESFRTFIANLLNHIDESKAQAWNNQYIKDAFKNHVSWYERLGTYSSPKKETVDLLIVYLTKDSKLERARTAIRNFVADHLKTRDEKDAALVAYVSSTEQQWRFSYVKMEYATIEKESGKVGIETRLTPAKRLSYLVGEGESSHTAQSRFINFLQNTSKDPVLAELEEAFSVEAVTKEFFKQYVKCFDAIKEDLDKLIGNNKFLKKEFDDKAINSIDFAKKLLGQIIFLYFLQKKGWLGVERGKEWGTGPKDFLRRLAKGEYSNYKNFFNDILEPLYYDTLATDRGHTAWDERFKCRLPFLNGGLFEPLGDYDWKSIDVPLLNTLFTNNEVVEENVIGNGVLDIFDRYNFTVNEAEPLEKEVAIDPEMLGKVFENLIEENRRKGLGAYYTPREIVHYMCQESLINYLDTSVNRESSLVPREDIETFIHLGEQISHYEAVDTEYRVKMPKSIEKNARLIDDKLKEITVCDPAIGSGAFPVGMMTEIVRSRLALTPYFNDIHERTAYYFKRQAIQNCLYGVDIDPGAVEIAKLRLWLSLVVDEEDVKQIRPLPNLDYKIVTGNSLFSIEKNLFNYELYNELEKVKPLYFDEADRKEKASLKKKIDNLISKLSNNNKIFDFEIYFSEIFHNTKGFAIVIANPPYISHDQIDLENKKALRKYYSTYSPFADLYCYFLERSLQLLKGEGVMCFITSNSYIKAEYGLKIRSLLSSKVKINELINIEMSQVFSNAIVNVAILLTQNSLNRQKEYMVKVANTRWTGDNFNNFILENSFAVPNNHFNNSTWVLESSSLLLLREKIESKHPSLLELGAKIRLGIATGANEAFLIDTVKRSELIKEHKSSTDIIVPVIRGRDITRYGNLKPSLFLIAARNGINIRRDYPAIYRHLNSFGESFKSRGAQGQNWWNLRACSFYNDFDEEKIVWMELTDTARFTYCKSGIWCLNSAYFLLPPPGFSREFIIGLLNSKVINFYFRLIAQTSGMGVPRWINIYVQKFPIPTVPLYERKHLEHKVAKIFFEKSHNDDFDTTKLENEIDKIVYDLYGLNQDDIKLIEKTISSTID